MIFLVINKLLLQHKWHSPRRNCVKLANPTQTCSWKWRNAILRSCSESCLLSWTLWCLKIARINGQCLVRCLFSSCFMKITSGELAALGGWIKGERKYIFTDNCVTTSLDLSHWTNSSKWLDFSRCLWKEWSAIYWPEVEIGENLELSAIPEFYLFRP